MVTYTDRDQDVASELVGNAIDLLNSGQVNFELANKDGRYGLALNYVEVQQESREEFLDDLGAFWSSPTEVVLCYV